MDSEPKPSPARRWLRRIVIGLLLVVVLAWPLYLLAFNLLLRQKILPSLVAKAGPKVHMDYDRAWTIWPNEIHVRGFSFAIEDRAVRLQITSPEAMLSLATDPNVWLDRRVGLRDLQAEDVTLDLSFLVPAEKLASTDLSLRPDIPQFDGPPVQTRKKLTPEMDAAELIWGVDLAGVDGNFTRIHVNDTLVEGDIDVAGSFVYRIYDRLAFDVEAEGELAARLGRALDFDALALDGRGTLPLRRLPTDEPPAISGRAKVVSSAPVGLDSPLGRVTLGDFVADLTLDDSGWSGPIDAPFRLAAREATAPITGHAHATAGGDRQRGVLESLVVKLSGLYDPGREVADEIEDMKRTKKHYAKQIQDEVQDMENTRKHFAKEIEDEVQDMENTRKHFAKEIQDEIDDMANTKRHFAEKLQRIEARRDRRLEEADNDRKRERIERRFARRLARVAEERDEELEEDRIDLARERAKLDKELVEDRKDLAAEKKELEEELEEDRQDLAKERAERKQQTWTLVASSSRFVWGRIGAIDLQGPIHVEASRGTPFIRRALPEDTPTPWARLFQLKDLTADAYVSTQGGALSVTGIQAASEGVEAWGDVHTGGGTPKGELKLVAGPLGLVLDIDGRRDKAVKAIPKPPPALR